MSNSRLNVFDILQILFMGLSGVAFTMVGATLFSYCDFQSVLIRYTAYFVMLVELCVLIIVEKPLFVGDSNEC